MDSLARRTGAYLRRHHVGLIAIFIALSGTAYAANTVRSDDIADGEIRNQDLANDSIGSAKIKPGGVGNSDLAANSVDSEKVVDGSLKGIDVLDGSLNNADLASNSLTGDRLVVGALTTRELALHSVNSSELAPRSVGGSEIRPDAVAASEIASGAVASAEIASSAVGASEVAAGAIGTSEHGAVPGARIGRGSNQGIPASNNPTGLNFTTDVYDPQNMRPSGQIDGLSIAVPGRYLITGHAVLAADVGGVRGWSLRRNDDTIAFNISGDDPDGVSLMTIHSLAAGDKIGMAVSCQNGCSILSITDASPILAVQWLGPA